MTTTFSPNFPSSIRAHRLADVAVHLFGLTLILGAGGVLLNKVGSNSSTLLTAAVALYILCALASNLASSLYHFSPWHPHRTLLRRLDHAAIYPSITGTFTPFFIIAGTPWTLTLLCLCWALTLLAIWHKLTHSSVKTRWSTASYLGLGALGLGALPDLTNVPLATLWCILGGSACYVIGTTFYARKSLPFRYAIWHIWVNLGGLLMFAGVWIAIPSSGS